jgi:hypothetical protein
LRSGRRKRDRPHTARPLAGSGPILRLAWDQVRHTQACGREVFRLPDGRKGAVRPGQLDHQSPALPLRGRSSSAARCVTATASDELRSSASAVPGRSLQPSEAKRAPRRLWRPVFVRASVRGASRGTTGSRRKERLRRLCRMPTWADDALSFGAMSPQPVTVSPWRCATRHSPSSRR